MRHDIISDVFNIIKTSENMGKKECIVPAQGTVKGILIVLQRHKYIGTFEFIDDGKSGKFKISLLGKINECGTIKPRFAVAKDGYRKYEKRFLPASGIGILIVSTSHGVIDHVEAIKKNTGGKLLGYAW